MHSQVAEQEAYLEVQGQQQRTRHLCMAMSNTNNGALPYRPWLPGIYIVYRWTGYNSTLYISKGTNATRQGVCPDNKLLRQLHQVNIVCQSAVATSKRALWEPC